MAFACLPLALAWVGCAAPGMVRAPYVVGLRYDLETAQARLGGDPGVVSDGDLAAIARLGFNTVFMQNISDQDRRRIVESARRCGLAAALPDGDVLHYVATGRLPRGCRSIRALADSSWPPAASVNPPPIAILGEVGDASTAMRVRRVAGALNRRADPWVTFAVVSTERRPGVTLAARRMAETDEARTGDLMLLECEPATGPLGEDAGRRWLRQYHLGLTSGLTGGLVVDGFDSVWGRSDGARDSVVGSGARRVTAMRRITARAAAWGPKLRRLTPEAIEPAGHSSDRLSVFMFGGPKRRFVLLLNTSTDEFLHGTVQLGATLDSTAVRRAVPVPPERQAMAGEVVRVRSDRLTLPLGLAPGDASLWEIF